MGSANYNFTYTIDWKSNTDSLLSLYFENDVKDSLKLEIVFDLKELESKYYINPNSLIITLRTIYI